jgi:UDP-3-O-[3-hydroxymyristoyl] glucosamine N-acyltransferase
VIGNLKAGSVVWGIPARPVGQVKRQMAAVAWLARNFSRVSKGTK